jgi:hypothetical protein
MTNEELINKLEEKRLQIERESYLVMEKVNEYNITEIATEMTVYRAGMYMIEEIQFLLVNGVWENELPSQVF